jgi:hypothetical protein
VRIELSLADHRADRECITGILIRSKESLVKILFATGVLTMAGINEVVVRGSAAGFAQVILAGRSGIAGRVFTLEQIKSLPKELLRSSALHSSPY